MRRPCDLRYTPQGHSCSYRSQEWSNADNVGFYENTPIPVLKHYAQMSGLDTGCDVQSIWSHINKANSLLELGGGYGRVIQKLVSMNFAGKITTIERCLKYYMRLKTKYSDAVEVLYRDINSLNPDRKFDVILWMWAGICEFSQEEQLPMLEKITSFLNHNGVLIFDIIPPHTRSANATSKNGKNQIIHSNFARICGYFPDDKEFNLMLKNFSSLHCECLEYKTTTGQSRLLHILRKI